MRWIYLAYEWLASLAITGNRHIDTALMMALVYGATWAFASLSYASIEQPFLRLRHRYGQ